MRHESFYNRRRFPAPGQLPGGNAPDVASPAQQGGLDQLRLDLASRGIEQGMSAVKERGLPKMPQPAGGAGAGPSMGVGEKAGARFGRRNFGAPRLPRTGFPVQGSPGGEAYTPPPMPVAPPVPGQLSRGTGSLRRGNRRR